MTPVPASGRLLLDTHVFLWAITADPRLSAKALAAYEEGQLLLSVASIWEIVAKYQLGRLELPAPPSQFLPPQIERNAIAVLPIRARHVLRAFGCAPSRRGPGCPSRSPLRARRRLPARARQPAERRCLAHLLAV